MVVIAIAKATFTPLRFADRLVVGAFIAVVVGGWTARNFLGSVWWWLSIDGCHWCPSSHDEDSLRQNAVSVVTETKQLHPSYFMHIQLNCWMHIQRTVCRTLFHKHLFNFLFKIYLFQMHCTMFIYVCKIIIWGKPIQNAIKSCNFGSVGKHFHQIG